MQRRDRHQRRRARGYAGAEEETEKKPAEKKNKIQWTQILVTAFVTGVGMYAATRGLDALRRRREEEERENPLDAAHDLLLNPGAVQALQAAQQPAPAPPAKVIILSEEQLQHMLAQNALH